MSDRKLVYKVTIDEIEPMDADTLEAARIGGWRVVCKKGDFHAGDTALYFEIDAALNPYDRRFEFLLERCYKKFNNHGRLFDECIRIRTMKLRGVISQGLLMKPELFCEVRNKKLGEDCSDVLMVRHYDEVAEKAAYESGSLRASNQKGLFPAWIPKTDEERVQNLNDETLTKFKDELLECTEKEDGTSCTIFYAASKRPDDPFGVCSRNFELKDEPSTYWDVAHELKLPEILVEYCARNNCNIALQGEITGPGIGCNRDCFEALTFQVFRIWDIDNQCFLTKQERYNVVSDLGLKHVPVLGRRAIKEFCAVSGNPDDYNGEPFNPTVARDNILKFAEGKTVRGNEREGVVFKSNDGKFSFKAVSNKYLMGLK